MTLLVEPLVFVVGVEAVVVGVGVVLCLGGVMVLVVLMRSWWNE